MTDKLENFKNVSIKVEELEKKVQIWIEPIDTSKEIEIYYKPKDNYRVGDYILRDNHTDVKIDRGYPVEAYDGEVDWDIETIY